jgi:RsiW-degrading membrane proteinase PrsW (M82 family)
MNLDWKLLSYAMLISVIIIWVCALIVSVLFIQPLLDMWRCLPQIISGNASYTFIGSKYPSIPLWILLVVSLFLWGVLTVFSYIIMNYLRKNKKEENTSS